MAVARARRLTEVFVVRLYVDAKKLSPPLWEPLQDTTLYRMIRYLANHGRLSQVIATSCHTLRLEGNRALHYQPEILGDSIKAYMTADKLLDILQDFTEVAEALTTKGHCAYVS